MKIYFRELDRKYFFPIFLAFTFALPFNTLAVLNSILMTLLFFLWAFRIYDSRGTILNSTPLDYPLLGFLAWAGLSLFWTVDIHETVNSYIALVKQIFLFYLTMTSVRTRDQFVKILISFLAAILIIDLYSGVDFFYRGGSILNRHIRAGSFGSLDYNLITMLNVILIPLAFVYGIHAVTKPIRIFLFVFTLISLFTLYLSYTRAGWITILIQLLVFGWYFSRRFFIISLLGVFGLLLLIFLTLPVLKKYNSRVSEPAKQIYSDDTVNPITLGLRLNVWKFGLAEILKNPIMGHGYGKGIFFIIFKDTDVVKDTSHLHNTFLETAFELGLPGLLLLLAIYWKILQRSRLILKNFRESFDSVYGLFMITMVSGFIFKNIFDHMFIGMIAEMFWIFSGLLFRIPFSQRDVSF